MDGPKLALGVHGFPLQVQSKLNVRKSFMNEWVRKNSKTSSEIGRSKQHDAESAGGSLWELCVFAIFFIILFSALARADEFTAGNLSTGALVISDSVPSNLDSLLFTLGPWQKSASFAVDTSRTLNPNDHVAYSGWYDLNLALTHKPTGVTTSVELGFSQEYNYSAEQDNTSGAFDNPIFRLSKTFSNKKDFNSVLFDSVILGLRGSLPANRDSYRQSFEGAIGTSITATKKISVLGLTQGFSYSRSFYQFDMSAAGDVNEPDTYRSSTALSLNITDNFALSASALLTYAMSFQGVGKSSQWTTLASSYKLSEQLSTAIGLMTRRGTIDTEMRTNRLQLFDQGTSVAFFDLSWAI
jgi:hypothetical protein